MDKKLPDVIVIRVYFEGKIDSKKIDALYDDIGYEFGGWRKDINGTYLRLIAVGDVPKEYLTKERFSKYGNIKEVVCESPWPEIPRKIDVKPLSDEAA